MRGLTISGPSRSRIDSGSGPSADVCANDGIAVADTRSSAAASVLDVTHTFSKNLERRNVMLGNGKALGTLCSARLSAERLALQSFGYAYRDGLASFLCLATATAPTTPAVAATAVTIIAVLIPPDAAAAPGAPLTTAPAAVAATDTLTAAPAETG